MGLVIGIVIGAVVLFFVGFVSFGGFGYAHTGNDNVEGCTAAAVTAYATQSQWLAEATRLESEALKLVNDSCPPDVAANCIASLPVCPV